MLYTIIDLFTTKIRNCKEQLTSITVENIFKGKICMRKNLLPALLQNISIIISFSNLLLYVDY